MKENKRLTILSIFVLASILLVPNGLVFGAVEFGSDDGDTIPVAELVPKGHDFTVDLGGKTVVADVGVHLIGEIDRGGAGRKRDHIPFRGEHIDLVGK